MEQSSGISYKKIISGVVLLLLLGSLPFIYYLVTQTQVFKPKASTYDIDIVPKTGVSVIQENGVPVIQTTTPDEFKIKITSPLDSQPGADAGFSIVKPAYAASYLSGDKCDGTWVAKSDGSRVVDCGWVTQHCGVIKTIENKDVAVCMDRTWLTGETKSIARVCVKSGSQYLIKYLESNGDFTDKELKVCNPLACKSIFDGSTYPVDAICTSEQPASLQAAPQQPASVNIDLDNRTTRWFCDEKTNSIIREYYEGLVYTGSVVTMQHQTCEAGTVCESKDPVIINGKSIPDAECKPGLPAEQSDQCQDYIQRCDGGRGQQSCKICPNQPYDDVCQPCVISAVPSAPAAVPDGTLPTIPRSQSVSPQVCGKQCIYSEGDVCKSGNCLDGSQNCGFNDNCGYVPGCSSGVTSTCPASGSTPSLPAQTGRSNAGGSAATTTVVDEFADHSLDGKRSVYACAEGPQDAEKPAGQYAWVADCSRKCMYNEEKGPGDPAGCPKNTVDQYVNSATSNWCYGFKDGNRCMQLKWTGAPATRTQTLPAANTQTIASAPAAPRTPAAPATPAQPAAPASTAPAPASPAQPNNAANNTTNTAGRRTTHYRVTADPSRFNDWDTYTPGGVTLPFGFPSVQPGTSRATVSLFVQFKDDQGAIFNARPYPIIIKYVASTTPPVQPQNNTASCTKGKVCGGSDTPCGANGVGKCDACNGGWCKGGFCETCAPDSAVPATRVACDDPSQITDAICGGGVKTYDTCTDNKSQTGASLCKNGATTFKCVGSKNDYCQSPEYQCSSCPNFAPVLTNPACGTTCGGCSLKDTCGNRTYDTCDTAPCSAAGATAGTTFKCYAKDSPNNCVGEYLCGSVCAGSAAAPATTRTTTTPTTGTSTPSYEPE